MPVHADDAEAVMCEPHAKQFRHRRIPITLERFLVDPRVQPLPPFEVCLVPACTRTADSAGGYCNTTISAGGSPDTMTPIWISAGGRPGNRVWPSPGR
jgi:hypothetical protein